MVTQRLAGLIGAPDLPDRALRPARPARMAAALPVHGLADEAARSGSATWSGPSTAASGTSARGRPYVSNRARAGPAPRAGDRAGGGRGVRRARAHALGGRGARPAGAPPTSRAASRDARRAAPLIFAGPAASFLRSRQIFDAAAPARRAPRAAGRAGGRHGGGRGPHAAARARRRPRVQRDLGYDRGRPSTRRARTRAAPRSRPRRARGRRSSARDARLLRWALRGSPRRSRPRTASGDASWPCPCAPASRRSACSTSCAAPPRRVRRRGAQPPLRRWPASWRVALQKRRERRRRPSAWRARWRRSTTSGWRRPRCATCGRSSSRRPRRPAG